jgi:hypothetical protein
MNIQKISDMRGSQYAANSLEIRNLSIHYAGYPVENLQPIEDARNKHYYQIISNNTVLGTIALRDEDFQTVEPLLLKNQIDFTRVKHDINGNPRFVCHFLNFVNEDDRKQLTGFDLGYGVALAKARQLGGRKFHNKQYGGGIVFQMYDGQQAEMSRRIKELNKIK